MGLYETFSLPELFGMVVLFCLLIAGVLLFLRTPMRAPDGKRELAGAGFAIPVHAARGSAGRRADGLLPATLLGHLAVRASLHRSPVMFFAALGAREQCGMLSQCGRRRCKRADCTQDVADCPTKDRRKPQMLWAVAHRSGIPGKDSRSVLAIRGTRGACVW